LHFEGQKRKRKKKEKRKEKRNLKNIVTPPFPQKQMQFSTKKSTKL
jgi:hypothetical protein